MTATRSNLDRSINVMAETPGFEHFWSTELNNDKKSYKWTVGEEDGEDEEDCLNHTLFLKLAVLGSEAIKDQSNVVTLESTDCDGKKVKGAIVHLMKGTGNLMCPLDITLSGKREATFTLEGSGPVHISGNYLRDFPKEDDFNITQSEVESGLDDSNDKDESEEEASEEKEEPGTKGKKAVPTKRKALDKGNKSKKAKMEKEEEEEEEEDEDEDEDMDEDDDDEEDEDDEDYEESPPKKATKKTKVPAKKAKKAVTPPKKAGKKAKK